MKSKIARELLEDKAPDAATMTYSEFANALGIHQAPIIRVCANILEEMMREDVRDNRPIVAALVVQKGNVAIPRKGFFEMLKALGLYQGNEVGPQAVQWHQQEIEKLKKYYNEVENE